MKRTWIILLFFIIIFPRTCDARSWWKLIPSILKNTYSSTVFDIFNRHEKKIFAAIEKNDVSAVKKLLEEKTDINILNKDGAAMLHRAAEHGYTEICSLLLKENADINIIQKNLLSPLISDIGRKSFSPLMCAAFNGHAETVSKLLEHNAAVEYETEYAWTALDCALMNGHAEAAEILLKNGADAKRKAKDNEAPLARCIESICLTGRYNVKKAQQMINALKKVFSYTDVNVMNKRNIHPLCVAFLNTQNTEFIKLLIDQGNADVNFFDTNGTALLTYAVQYGDISVVELILSKNIDLSAKNSKGQTVLDQALETTVLYNKSQIRELLNEKQ